jgi:hypothetical protein
LSSPQQYSPALHAIAAPPLSRHVFSLQKNPPASCEPPSVAQPYGGRQSLYGTIVTGSLPVRQSVMHWNEALLQ